MNEKKKKPTWRQNWNEMLYSATKVDTHWPFSKHPQKMSAAKIAFTFIDI